MTLHPEFRAYFEDVAKRLRLLGRRPGAINLAFVEGPETATTLMVNLKDNFAFPCLLVEFEDQDGENGESNNQVLHSAFIVLDQAKTGTKGANEIEAAVYQKCKPAADQIAALMRVQSEKMKLKLGGRQVSLSAINAGNWVGPLHNGLYGWRIEFSWRVSGSSCVDPEAWDEVL